MNWYLLQTKPNAHVMACKNLRQQGFDVFLPLMIKTAKKNGKFLDIKTPLFPGYIFMGTLSDPIPWKSVNGTKGITSAVTLDGIYRPIPTDIIEGLKQRCIDQDIFRSLRNIDVGDRAKIESGPFAEFICTIEQIKNKDRIWVLIDLLQQQTKTEVSLDRVSKIN